MKSVGEVMAIGRNFEEAIQKAIRMLEIGKDGLVSNSSINSEKKEDIESIEQALLHPTDDILFSVVRALQIGMEIDRINSLSLIDPWFLFRIKSILDTECELKKAGFDKDTIRKAKTKGFSDKQIARCLGTDELKIRGFRKKFGIKPIIKQIDSLSAEWPARTNYLYMTYSGATDDIKIRSSDKGVVVLGAGPYRIGSSVEFDWGTVNMVWGLKENGISNVSIINCNPETVSTDYDISDRLYFEELTFERVMDIYEKEHPTGIVTCVGGQSANNLTPRLAEQGAIIIGTKSEDVDRAEEIG